MFLAGVRVSVVKQICDWKGDCVYRYLTADINEMRKIISTAVRYSVPC
ncbi:hypothetical protein LSH36_541g02037 [Paralvinella palmiformis]|uniref:Uncharacterized protein n=1 Tax=Paralvinella palmiformis TaxID=53620 RepID=A0AAD9MXT1_9ANNE|nr:hypothetical protein LSH36_541g02037 [Paralvinella palmiformis]